MSKPTDKYVWNVKLSGWPSGLRRQTQGRINTFPSSIGGGRSGLRMEAWFNPTPDIAFLLLLFFFLG